MNVILRIIATPFLAGIILIKYNYHALNHLWFFLRYGGEWITYAKDDKATIQEIFDNLKLKP